MVFGLSHSSSHHLRVLHERLLRALNLEVWRPTSTVAETLLKSASIDGNVSNDMALHAILHRACAVCSAV